MYVMISPLWTIGSAAREFGTTDATIRGLVRALRITTKPVPHSPRGKGLDARDMRRLAKSLGQAWKV